MISVAAAYNIFGYYTEILIPNFHLLPHLTEYNDVLKVFVYCSNVKKQQHYAERDQNMTWILIVYFKQKKGFCSVIWLFFCFHRIRIKDKGKTLSGLVSHRNSNIPQIMDAFVIFFCILWFIFKKIMVHNNSRPLSVFVNLSFY